MHPARFAEQIAWIAANRRVVALEELLNRVPSGVSRSLVALTFDDGFGSVIEHAVPILSRFNLPFTVFLIGKMYDGSGASVDWVDAPPEHALRTLDADEVRETRARGSRSKPRGPERTAARRRQHARLPERTPRSRGPESRGCGGLRPSVRARGRCLGESGACAAEGGGLSSGHGRLVEGEDAAALRTSARHRD
ncbi:MAG: polysaccharide deacetylase family protein, partial [Acidobacteria bacterium]|nr:polysaccharide deacetylase family protein [Acidobacteriota bacterium]